MTWSSLVLSIERRGQLSAGTAGGTWLPDRFQDHVARTPNGMPAATFGHDMYDRSAPPRSQAQSGGRPTGGCHRRPV